MMTHVNSSSTRHWQSLAVLTDFDGTVADIVTDPNDARPVEEAVEGLQQLSSCIGLVGIVSGRPLEFLRQHLPEDLFRSALVAGSYGEQIVLPGTVEMVVPSSRTNERVSGASALEEGFFWVKERLLFEGVEIEDKPHSFTIHYRKAPQRRSLIEEMIDQLEDEFGLKSLAAKQAVEFFEGERPSKVSPVRNFTQGYDFAVYLGDDISDIEVFEYLDMSYSERVASLKVAVASDEAPRSLLELADVVLESPGKVGRWLKTFSEVISCHNL